MEMNKVEKRKRAPQNKVVETNESYSRAEKIQYMVFF
jgi:hypothetical protein